MSLRTQIFYPRLPDVSTDSTAFPLSFAEISTRFRPMIDRILAKRIVPVVAAIGGSWMVDKQLVNDGKWAEITRITREALEAAAAC